jgi:ADP-heptose:LPS heptosyltransferase/glycosyltransferase involved in cell wall biosynthesis
MKTIGLCMIVKNEARVIERCLDSARPLIDYVLIEDTGSTDGTQDIIRGWLDRHALPGQVFDEPWRDFAYNRSLALVSLREKADIDYALVIDADDVLVFEHGFDPAKFKAALAADFYDVAIRLGGIQYGRPQIFSNRCEFRYRGVLHEFIEAPSGELSRATAVGFYMQAGVEGGRSQDPEKYRKDAELLEQALAAEQDPFLRSRYTFYLAQSWFDSGANEKALAAYLDRATQGYWDEEVFISLYRAGQIKEALNHPGDEIIGMYSRAWEACPRRAESLHAAAHYCWTTGWNHLGYLFAKQGLAILQPDGGLFVESWIYDFCLLDELAINAYWTGQYQECLDACNRLLSEGKMPEGMRERVEMNAKFAREKLEPSRPTSASNEVPLAAGIRVLERIGIDAVAEKPVPVAAHLNAGSDDPDPTFRCCPLCGATETSKPRLDLDPHPYIRCAGCGLFYQPNMRPKVFEAQHEIRGDLMSSADREANRHLATIFFHNHLARKFAGRTLFHLDIGSKYPYFGHCLQAVAAEQGRQLTSHGIDGILEAREFGRQLGVLMAVGDFESDPRSWDMSAAMRELVINGGFHCVTLIHCLEHFYHPLRTLRTIRELLVDGGILFIRSPDSEAPGIERDFTPGHYDIHPTIWCESAMNKAVASLQDAFEIYETYELGPQRDYLLRAVNRTAIANDREGHPVASANKPHKVERSVINIFRPGAIGDVLATSAVTAQLAILHPDAEICYYTKVPEIAELLVGVRNVLDADEWEQRKAGMDWCAIGYPIAEGYPERPMRKHLTAYFCQEASLPPGPPQLSGELKPYDIEQPRWVTIHPQSGWSVYKEWSPDDWNEIIARIHRTYPGVAVVQIGGSADLQLRGTDHDLRGRTSISQALWLVKNSLLHLGVDSFTNHAAGAFGHPAVVLFGSTSPTGSGYDSAVNLWAGMDCSPCYREDPRLSRQSRGPCINPPGQDYEHPRHACMAAITVEAVWAAIAEIMPEEMHNGADANDDATFVIQG